MSIALSGVLVLLLMMTAIRYGVIYQLLQVGAGDLVEREGVLVLEIAQPTGPVQPTPEIRVTK